MTYTSETHDSINRMTYPQFKLAVEAVGEKINFQIKLAYASISTDPITEDDIPLYINKNENNQRLFRLDDALALQQIANKK